MKKGMKFWQDYKFWYLVFGFVAFGLVVWITWAGFTI